MVQEAAKVKLSYNYRPLGMHAISGTWCGYNSIHAWMLQVNFYVSYLTLFVLFILLYLLSATQASLVGSVWLGPGTHLGSVLNKLLYSVLNFVIWKILCSF